MSERGKYPGWDGTEGVDPNAWHTEDEVFDPDWPVQGFDPNDYLGQPCDRVAAGGEGAKLIWLLPRRALPPQEAGAYNAPGAGLDDSFMHSMGGHS